MEILQFYPILFRIFQIFRKNLDINLGIFENLHFKGFGGGAPEASESMNNLLEKSMETSNFLKFASIPSYFLLVRCDF